MPIFRCMVNVVINKNKSGDNMFSYGETKYLSVVETARIIRKALKNKFEGTKFSVRSDKYAGGASINISWTDGPTSKEVEEITNLYNGKGFDGMIDLAYSYSHWLMPDGSIEIASSGGTANSGGTVPSIDNPKPHPKATLVHFGSDYVFTRRNYTEEALKVAKDWVVQEHGSSSVEIKKNTYGGAFYLCCNNELLYEGGPHYVTASGEAMNFISEVSF